MQKNLTPLKKLFRKRVNTTKNILIKTTKCRFTVEKHKINCTERINTKTAKMLREWGNETLIKED